MPHSIEIEEFRDLSNWAQLWLSDVAHYEWGYNRENLVPLNSVAVNRNANSGQYAFDDLLQRGPLFCAAAGQWHDQINAAKPDSSPVELQIGFVALSPQQYSVVPADRGVSAHSLAAEWMEKLGVAIVGRKPWTAAVAAAGPVAPPADYPSRRTELIRKLYLHFEGVESLRLRMQDELSRVRTAATGQSPADAGKTRTVGTGYADSALAALLTVFTNGVSDARITQAAVVISDASLTVEQKLRKIDALLPFPPTASAGKLASMLGVSANAVKKTGWWIQNRKGKANVEIDARKTRLRERSQRWEDGSEDGEE